MYYPFFVCIWLKNSIFGEFSNIYLLSAQNRVKWRHKIRPIAKNFRPILIFFARDVKLMPGEVCQVSCRYSNKWRSYFGKTEGVGSDPPGGGGLTLAGTGHFASFHGTRGGGGVGTTPPLAVSPLIELELRGKNERVARRETKRLIYKLKVLGQPVTSEVRSSAEKCRKPWSPITLLLMELEQNFNVKRVPCDELNTLRWFLNAH